MIKNEIKKALYKEKPVAMLKFMQGTNYVYEAILSDYKVYFSVPISDMGEKLFENKMEGQLLIRWIDETWDR